LLHIAVHFAANSPKTSRKHGLFQRKFVFFDNQKQSLFSPLETFARIDYLLASAYLVANFAFIMLNFVRFILHRTKRSGNKPKPKQEEKEINTPQKTKANNTISHS
jgi:hypothetical protein